MTARTPPPDPALTREELDVLEAHLHAPCRCWVLDAWGRLIAFARAAGEALREIENRIEPELASVLRDRPNQFLDYERDAYQEVLQIARVARLKEK